MKYLLTVMNKNGDIVKQAVMEPGSAMASAGLEVMEGNTIAMSQWSDEFLLVSPDDFNFDTRYPRSVN